MRDSLLPIAEKHRPKALELEVIMLSRYQARIVGVWEDIFRGAYFKHTEAEFKILGATLLVRFWDNNYRILNCVEEGKL